MALDINLELARQAVDYVRLKLPLGAWDKYEDLEKDPMAVIGCGVDLRLNLDINNKDPHYVARMAMGEKYGCGNCGEQAAVAFDYLSRYTTRPLEWVGLRGRCGAGICDHAFVLMARKRFNNDPSTWGADCVVCDPWLEVVYPGKDIMTGMETVLKGSPLQLMVVYTEA
jgi:hypothetical protein